jgi:hypothetical protein
MPILARIGPATEDRLPWSTTVQHIEAELGRRMAVAESAALHAVTDIMLQRSVIALVDEQKSGVIRAGASFGRSGPK